MSDRKVKIRRKKGVLVLDVCIHTRTFACSRFGLIKTFSLDIFHVSMIRKKIKSYIKNFAAPKELSCASDNFLCCVWRCGLFIMHTSTCQRLLMYPINHIEKFISHATIAHNFVWFSRCFLYNLKIIDLIKRITVVP